MKRIKSKKVKALMSLALFLLVLAGPFATFFLMWMVPKVSLEPISPDIGSSWVAEGLSEYISTMSYETLLIESNLVGLPSTSAAIAYNGSLQWAGAVGFSDIPSETHVTLDSRYRLGSVSKALTGTLLARLLDKGVINLDALADEYYPNIPNHLKEITPRMLASHTAGVRHYSNSLFLLYWPGWHPAFSNTKYENVEAGLDIFIGDDLLFEPSTGFNYSTYGFSLLSMLLEGASGTNFENLLISELFTPAGMEDTVLDHPGAMEERVSFYTTSSEKYSKAKEVNTSYKIAGGGMVSTPTDIVNLGQLLLGNSFISEINKELMWTPVNLSDGSINPQNYGLGWRIDTSTLLLGEDMPTTIIHHGGSQVGGVAFFMLVPEYGISVAVMSNTNTDGSRRSVQNIAYELARLAVEEINKE